MKVVLVSAGGLSSGDINFISDGGGGRSSDSRPTHDRSRLVYVLNGKGAEICIVNEVGSVDVCSLNIVTKTVSGVDSPGGGICLSAGRGKIAGGVRNGGAAIGDSKGMIFKNFDGIAVSAAGGDGQNIGQKTRGAGYQTSIVKIHVGNSKGKRS